MALVVVFPVFRVVQDREKYGPNIKNYMVPGKNGQVNGTENHDDRGSIGY